MHAYSLSFRAAEIDNESEIEIVRHGIRARVSADPIGKIEWSSAIRYPPICALHVDDRWARTMKKLFSPEYQSVCITLL